MRKEKGIAKVKWTEEPSEEFGKIAKIKMPNGSLIYVYKAGWGLKTSEKEEEGILLPWNEINLAVKMSLKLGYRSSKGKVMGNQE